MVRSMAATVFFSKKIGRFNHFNVDFLRLWLQQLIELELEFQHIISLVRIFFIWIHLQLINKKLQQKSANGENFITVFQLSSTVL
jgi:hypothetical protein